MKHNVRTFLSILLGAVFLLSTLLLLRQYWHEQQAETAYRKAEQLVASSQEPSAASDPSPTETSPAVTESAAVPVQETKWIPAPIEEDDPNIKNLSGTNLSELRKTNSDIIGWIQIPDTQINYPVLQTDNNTYYLDHAWDNTKNIYGSIFLEQQNTPDMTDFNTIIYGHNMRNGSMFADLHDFADDAFIQSHPYVYLVTDSGILRYEIFSTYDAPVDSSAYGLSFRQKETRTVFLQAALESSLVDTGIVPSATDRFLTLSTCTGVGYSSRRVVQARLQMIEVTAE